jgi:hypothetical protein
MITNFKYQFIQSSNKHEFLSVCYFEFIKYNRVQTYLHYCSEYHIEPTEDYISWLHKTLPSSKELIIQVLLLTSKGRQKLADSMAQPLKTHMDYGSLARRAFIVEPIPQGALPNFRQEQNIPTLVRPTSMEEATDLLARFSNIQITPTPYPQMKDSFV